MLWWLKYAGVDLIIKDIKQVATNQNYGVIEANFNQWWWCILPS